MESPDEDAIELDITDFDVTIGASEDEPSSETPLDYESMSPGRASPRPAALPQAEPDTDPLEGTAHTGTSAESDGRHLLGALSATPMFSGLSQAVLTNLGEQSKVQRTEAGERLISAGDDAEALFVIVEGRAQIVLPGVEAEPTVLDEGNVFGEACILDDVTHRAHVDAATSLLVASIPKDVVDDLVLEHEDVGEALLELFTTRSVASLIQTSGLFATLDGPMRSEMAKLFDVRRAEAGETLVEAGTACRWPLRPFGRLPARPRRRDGHQRPAPPAMFGQSSFLSGTSADATISSMSDALLLRLPASRFAELAALYPTVLMTLTEITAQAGFGDIWTE